MELIENATNEKLRGGFYTPAPLVKLICDWLVSNGVRGSVLEPSCGDGNFLSDLSKIGIGSITAIEYDVVEYNKALARANGNVHVINEDFHSYCNSTLEKFDAVVGNPPYIRYQYFEKDQREEAIKIFERAGLKYSKLMNAWVSFVVGSSLLLKENGKIAFVLPAEILQVGYAKTLRKFLTSYYRKISILTFRKLVFEGIQQEVVVVFCDRDGKKRTKIDHFELNGLDDLAKFDVTKINKPSKIIQHANSKWTHYFLNSLEIDFLKEVEKHDSVVKLGDLCKVEVGITTGANPFFTVTDETVVQYDLQDYAYPMVGRSVQVPSIYLTKRDWMQNVLQGSRAYFLIFPTYNNLNEGAKRYISEAEVSNKYHRGYKCRIRDEWFIVPSISVSDGLFIRRNNIYPKIINNGIGAYTTDTMHRVWTKQDVSLDSVIGSYYNSLSLAHAELQGRSHGGGVLELMPNETERIALPYFKGNAEHISEIDEMLRNNQSIIRVLEVMNRKILKNQLGLSKKEVILCEGIRCKLLGRRMSRGGKKSPTK